MVANVVENRQFDVFVVAEFRRNFLRQIFEVDGKFCEDVKDRQTPEKFEAALKRFLRSKITKMGRKIWMIHLKLIRAEKDWPRF